MAAPIEIPLRDSDEVCIFIILLIPTSEQQQTCNQRILAFP